LGRRIHPAKTVHRKPIGATSVCLPPLYKFLDVRGAKLTLGNRTFKFAKPSDFNDVEDLTVQSVFPEDIEAALRRLARSFTEVVLRNLDTSPVCDEPDRTKLMKIQQAFRINPKAVELARQHDLQQDANNVERFRAQSQDLLAQLNSSLQTWRVLCVTTDIASERMWSEYAQNHRGAALRITAATAKDSRFQLFRPVEYLEARPPLYRETLDFMEGYFFVDQEARTTEMIRRIIYSKTLQWQHEKEYRLAIPTRQHEEDWNTLLYQPEEIAELYLGMAMTDQDKTEIIGAAKAINPEIEVFQTCRASDQSITFNAI
jgi:hypothetical protein